MATHWTAQQTYSTSTPSLLAGYPGPISSLYYIYPYLSAFPSQNIISLSAKPWPTYRHFEGLLIHLRLSKWLFFHLFFLIGMGKGKCLQMLLGETFPKLCWVWCSYGPFPGSTYRSVRLPVDAFCSAWFMQPPEEEGCLVLFLFICRVTQ